MAVQKKTFRQELAEVSKDVGRPVGAFLFVVVLPRNVSRSFFIADMAKVPDQVTDFNCYVKSASVKW